MHTCAICNRKIRLGGICVSCYKHYGKAKWVIELTKIHRSKEYYDNKIDVFSDFSEAVIENSQKML